jgi:hypothetical protein
MKVGDMDMGREALVMAVALDYMDHGSDRERVRFMHHLMHKYFPDGHFAPERPVAPPRHQMSVPPIQIPGAVPVEGEKK